MSTPFGFLPIGTGAALPARGRHPSAHLVQVNGHNYLIDCGEGTQMRLRSLGIKISRLDHIFISHLHGDHYLGLVGLISSMHLNGRRSPLHVYGPRMLKEIIDLQLKASGTYLRFPLEFSAIGPINGEQIHKDERVVVTTLELKHRIDCVGFVFKEALRKRNLRKEKLSIIPHYARTGVQLGEDLQLEDGTMIPNQELTHPASPPRSVAYCSDTAPDEAIISHINGVDLLYHEATFMQELAARAKETYHSTAAQAASIAKAANVGKLLLGHFSSRYKTLEPLLEEARAVFPNTDLAKEGKLYTINDPVVENL